MPSSAPDVAPFAKAFRLAYPMGMVLCVAWPLALQLLLGTVIRQGPTPPGGVAEQLGYTFSGLTLLIALFLTWRWGKVRAAFAGVPAQQQPAIVFREILLYAALLELTSLFGILYYALAGPLAERYSRSFIALTSIMFFVFVPRLDAWRHAAQGE